MPDEEDSDASTEERVKLLKSLREELKLDIHELTDAECDMVPKMDPNYVPSEELIEAARDIKRDWKYPGLGLAPNFILEGDAGSGKTSASIFWAYVFGIPRTKMTMNPTFESANLIGAFYPVFRDIEDWNLTKSDMSVIKKVKELVEKEEFTGHYTPGSKDLLTAIRRSLAAPEALSVSPTISRLVRKSHSTRKMHGLGWESGASAPMKTKSSQQLSRRLRTRYTVWQAS